MRAWGTCRSDKLTGRRHVLANNRQGRGGSGRGREGLTIDTSTVLVHGKFPHGNHSSCVSRICVVQESVCRSSRNDSNAECYRLCWGENASNRANMLSGASIFRTRDVSGSGTAGEDSWHLDFCEPWAGHKLCCSPAEDLRAAARHRASFSFMSPPKRSQSEARVRSGQPQGCHRLAGGRLGSQAPERRSGIQILKEQNACNLKRQFQEKMVRGKSELSKGRKARKGQKQILEQDHHGVAMVTASTCKAAVAVVSANNKSTVHGFLCARTHDSLTCFQVSGIVLWH